MKSSFAVTVLAMTFLAAACSAREGPGSAQPASSSLAPATAATTLAPASEAPSSAVPDGSPSAMTHTSTPFAVPGSDACFVPPQAGCIDPTDDDSIRITFTVPDGWSAGPDDVALTTLGNAPPVGASVFFTRGASLYNEPCRNDGIPDIAVGPTVNDFANAIANHPLLDVTAPIVTTLGGHTGKYAELQVPSDPTIQGSNDGAGAPGCPIYRPWEPGLFAQGPSQRWQLWILDVDGVRVVVQAMDYPATAAQHRAELQAIVDSIEIEP